MNSARAASNRSVLLSGLPSTTSRVPACVKGEEMLFGKRCQELDGKKGIAGRLLVHQPRKRCSIVPSAVNGIGDELAQILDGERRDRELAECRSGFANGLERQHQGMGWADLVFPVGADHEKVARVRVGDHILEEFEGRRVEPLEVVQEQHAWMLLLGKHGEEPTKDCMKAVLGLARSELWNRHLGADESLDIRDKIDDELAIAPQSLAELGPPQVELGFASAKDLTEKTLEGLCQDGVWNVTLELVELARCKQASRQHDHPMQLVDDRRLADAGIPGHEDEF